MFTKDSVASVLSLANGGLKTIWTRWGLLLVGAVVFLAVVFAGNSALKMETARIEAQRKAELTALGSLLQTRLVRELSDVLSPLVGLNSYLVVRGGNLNGREVNAILERLHASVRHARNLAIAVGSVIRYVHPTRGNEKLIGLDYRSLPAQWPGVRRTIGGGAPILLGPMPLVQGGSGLVYRVPVLHGGKYWGLVSTVIDAESLITNAFGDAAPENVELAVRGRDARGMRGGVFWGDAELFERGGVEIVEVDVPGGKWVIGMHPVSSGLDERVWPLRVLVWVLAAFMGWGAYSILAQRAHLARLAMYDSLTGLANRSLIEDRMDRAISAQRRNPATVSALLFVDLDGFKRVNDKYGHRAGDTVLQAVAARAVRAVRNIDSVGRWGGDELVVVLESTDRQKIPELIERVRQAVETPLDFAGQSLRVGASIGSAIVPDDAESAADLIRLADRRMYEDKHARRRPGAKR
jgi:diguanylate cyclase (GGDEF)-like protein